MALSWLGGRAWAGRRRCRRYMSPVVNGTFGMMLRHRLAHPPSEDNKIEEPTG